MDEDERDKDIDVVYDHIILDKPEKKDKKQQIVIPKEIKSNKDNDDENK